MQKERKITPLHVWHAAHGANMADFGGYEMPLWYSTAKKEHLAVLTSADIFDTSHMAVVMVAGPGAYDLLQLCFTNDLAACIGKSKKPLSSGRCVYGAYLNEKGEVIDDTIIYQLEENSYMAVVNAGMGAGNATCKRLSKTRKRKRYIRFYQTRERREGRAKRSLFQPHPAR